jgi:hypothetical protein
MTYVSLDVTLNSVHLLCIKVLNLPAANMLGNVHVV